MKKFVKPILQATTHTALAPLERRVLERYKNKERWPHVFILGAPRSGTSLFYELLVSRYQFSFFSNLAHRFWKTPVAASYVGRKIITSRSGAYQSTYGHISGWSSPNEGGWIWQRWLVDGPWADESILSNLPVDEMRATLAAMSNIFTAPFVNKNVMHSNRIRLLNALFPECLFIEVRRDPTETVRSIIRAQRRHKGPEHDNDGWWSVRPSSAGGADMIERACRQVKGIATDIAKDCAHLDRDCLHIVDYAALCSDPHKTLAQTAAFLENHGVPMTLRAEVPDRFEVSNIKPLSVGEEKQIAVDLEKSVDLL